MEPQGPVDADELFPDEMPDDEPAIARPLWVCLLNDWETAPTLHCRPPGLCEVVVAGESKSNDDCAMPPQDVKEPPPVSSISTPAFTFVASSIPVPSPSRSPATRSSSSLTSSLHLQAESKFQALQPYFSWVSLVFAQDEQLQDTFHRFLACRLMQVPASRLEWEQERQQHFASASLSAPALWSLQEQVHPLWISSAHPLSISSTLAWFDSLVHTDGKFISNAPSKDCVFPADVPADCMFVAVRLDTNWHWDQDFVHFCDWLNDRYRKANRLREVILITMPDMVVTRHEQMISPVHGLEVLPARGLHQVTNNTSVVPAECLAALGLPSGHLTTYQMVQVAADTAFRTRLDLVYAFYLQLALRVANQQQ